MKRLLLVVAIIALFYSYSFARYYDTRIGRFLQTDPHQGNYPAWTPYNYAMNNPIIFIDANGKDVGFHESARNNANFNRALNLSKQTELGARQMERFKNDHDILVIYQVGDMSTSSGGTVAGVTDWKIGSNQADQVTVGSTEMGIKEQTFDNNGKVVITITLDAENLNGKSGVYNAETIYHEGKTHIEYDRDKGDLTGTAVDSKTEHQLYGTDGTKPAKKGSPAAQFIKQVKDVKEKEDE